MARVLETKACTACGKARRRCGKQTPQCLRCKTRGIDCRYPPSKPSQFVKVICTDDETPTVTPESSACSALQTAASSPVHVDTTLSSSLDIFNLPPIPLEIDQLASSWFSSQPTWLIRFPPASRSRLCRPPTYTALSPRSASGFNDGLTRELIHSSMPDFTRRGSRDM